MYLSSEGAGYHPGQARYANAVYAYEPDFHSTDYREGFVEEDAAHVVVDFYTPYIIAATPRANVDDRGRLSGPIDLTDDAKSWHRTREQGRCGRPGMMCDEKDWDSTKLLPELAPEDVKTKVKRPAIRPAGELHAEQPKHRYVSTRKRKPSVAAPRRSPVKT